MFARVIRRSASVLPRARAARVAFGVAGARSMSRIASSGRVGSGLGVFAAIGLSGVVCNAALCDSVDYQAVRNDISEILDNENYDDGSIGPVLVRLAWHTAGTWCQHSKTGGSNGATIRFAPEANYGANAGLNIARNFLEPIKAKYPGLTYADLYTLAGAVAVEEMGGPRVPWSAGRSDAADGSACTPDGRLPDAAQTETHLRDIFYRQGFNDQEIVALSGAHTLGRCHTDRSGFDGPWNFSPITFSNEYFQDLLNRKWTARKWSGPFQYADESGALMMLPTDMCLTSDPTFTKWVNVYAKDEQRFFRDFAKAFGRMLANGVPGQ